MKIVYAVESLDPSGGVRVVIEHAAEFARRGHEVAVLTKHPPVGWIDVPVELRVTGKFTRETIPACDILVATWFPTAVPCFDSRRGQVTVHFCQGYEGDHSYLRPRMDEVRQAYLLPTAKLVISKALKRRLEPMYPGPYCVVPQAIDASLFTPETLRASCGAEPSIGICGPFEFDLKGIRVCLEAVRELRKLGIRPHVFRVSHMPLSAEERELEPEAAYAYSIPAQEMPRWYQQLDLLLFGSFPGEGFPLPPLEAMASGVPAILTDIPSFETVPPEAALKVPPGNAPAMARAAFSLLSDPDSWKRHQIDGLNFVRQLTISRAVDTVEEFFERLHRRT